MRTALMVWVFGLASVWAQGGGVAGLAWMEGHWSGQMGRAALEEVWIAPAGGAMLGVSRTVARDRMVAFEFLRIESRADGIYYVAQPGGRPPTAFKLTRSAAALAVFENPQHDHPKKITYRLEGANTLVAAVEGDEGGKPKLQEFRFERKAEARK
ncbi:MAG: hypothetical protein JNN08_24325 [Bryobacterales bacterium]|nr:hypothetical protein [Bryobacterales bacterium]